MRVAGQIDQQIAEDQIDLPRENRCTVGRVGYLLERDFHFVQSISAAFIDARSLTGRSDETARKQVRQRRMVVPITDQASQQIRPPQKRTVERRRRAQHHMVPPAGPGMPPVEIKLLRAQTAVEGLLVDSRRRFDQFVPRRRRMRVDFDDARIRSHLDIVQAIIVRRKVAFEHDRRFVFSSRFFNRRHEI